MTTADLPPIIQSKLGQMRRQLAAWFWIDGLCRLAISCLVLFGLSLGIDRYFRMDRPQRLIMLLMMAGFIAWIIYRRLIRPLGQRMDDEALALQVERRHRELGDGLISAVQLSKMADPSRSGASMQMVGEAVRLGVSRSSAVDFSDVLDHRSRKRTLGWGIGSAVLLIGLVAGMGGVVQTWANRNLMLGSAQWPQQTYLRVLGLNADGELIVPKGDDMVLSVEASGVVPSAVSIDHQPTGGKKTTEPMALVGENQFHITFKNVLGEFRFRVRGNDAISEYYRVKTVDRPELLKDIGLRLIVYPPAYIGSEPRELELNTGSFSVPLGSAVEVISYATKPLRSASIELGREWSVPMTIGDAPAQRVKKSAESFEDYPAGPRQASVKLPPERLASGSYGIRLEDADGLAARRPIRFILKVQPDRDPTVRAVLRGIGDLISDRALIPLAIRASDDYAVMELSMEYSIAGGLEEGVEAAGPQRQAISGEGVPALGVGEVEDFVHGFDIQPLSLVPGVVLNFAVVAVDNDTVTHPAEGAKSGRSTAFTLKVVSDEELRTELLRREAEQRVEFERAIAQQEELIVDAKALEAAVVLARDRGQMADGKFTVNQLRQLGQIEKLQRLLAGRCESVAAQYAQILQEVANNRLEDAGGPLQARLQLRIVDPLEQLASDVIPPLADRLDALRAAELSIAQRLEQLAKAIELQEDLLEQMNVIKRSMIKSEGYQEMVNLLREILKAQQDIEDKTVKELEKQIEGIFED